MTLTSNPSRAACGRSVPRAATLLAAALLAFAAAPIYAAQSADACKGRRVTRLGGPHAVLRKPLTDLADLQKRLPELEAGIRQMIAEDSSIGEGAAEALLAAIREGAVSERKLGRQEAVDWMVYQPKRGELARIAPPCVQLDRDYDAFEITVEVPEPMPVAPDDARCALAVTRHCEHNDSPTIGLDVTGSSAGATVSQDGKPLAGHGAAWSIPDPAPCSKDLTFTVHAAGTPPPPHMARVYRFLIPKRCANLAYLGEAPRKQLAPAGAPKTCEKTVASPHCEPWAEVTTEPERVEEDSPVTVRVKTWSDCPVEAQATHRGVVTPIALDPTGMGTFTPVTSCWDDPGYTVSAEVGTEGKTVQASTNLTVDPHRWTLRPSLVYFSPRDGEQRRTSPLAVVPPTREKYTVDDGLGVGLSLEKRLNARWGVEGAALFGRAKTTYQLTTGGETGSDDHNANYFAFTVGPNLHLLKCKAADLYVGLFAGYGGLADPNYWVFGNHFHAELDGDFIWGAQIGVDVPFKPESNWGFHGGLRYFGLDQKTDAGTFDVNPLILEAGLSYRF